MRRWAEVEAFNSVRGPRATIGGVDVDGDEGTGDSDWMCSEVIGVAKEAFIGRDSRITAAAAKEIDCQFGLWDKFIKEVKRKAGMDASHHGNEMIFEMSNKPFSNVGTVIARWDVLVADADGGEEGLESLAGFIV
jgi:hypothetical protein